MVAVRRVSVRLDEATVERARQRAGPRGLSAYLAAALEEKLERDEQQEFRDERNRLAFIAWLDELNEADPPTPEEEESARQWVAQYLAEVEASR